MLNITWVVRKLLWRWCESVGQWSTSSWGFLGSRMWGGGNHAAFTAAVWALSLVIPSVQCLCSLLVLLTWSTLYVYVHRLVLGALRVWDTMHYSQLLGGFWHWYAEVLYTLTCMMTINMCVCRPLLPQLGVVWSPLCILGPCLTTFMVISRAEWAISYVTYSWYYKL